MVWNGSYGGWDLIKVGCQPIVVAQRGFMAGRSQLTLRCCCCCCGGGGCCCFWLCSWPPTAICRSDSFTELKLPWGVFFRLSSLPMAERNVDRFRCGGPPPSRDSVEPSASEGTLMVEYRAELDGLVRCWNRAELRGAEPETLEARLSGLGPESPAALPGGLPVGVAGWSETLCVICATSAISIVEPSGNVCDTSGGGGGGGTTNDTATGEGNAEGTVCRGARSSFSIGVELATAVPGFRMGNSSSSSGFGMGIGPEMRPRTVWWPVLGRAVVGEVGALPKILGFIASSTDTAVLTLRAVREKLRTEGVGVVSLLLMAEVEVGGWPGGLREPSGMTIR